MVETSVANHDLAVAGVVGEVHHQSCELFRQNRLGVVENGGEGDNGGGGGEGECVCVIGRV